MKKFIFGKSGQKEDKIVKGRRIPISTSYRPAFHAEMFRPHAFDMKRYILNPSFSNPRVEIALEALLDMYNIAGYAGYNEVGWLGTVQRKGDVLRIEEIFLFKQDVTGSSTDLNCEHVAEVATQLIAEGNMEKVNALKHWGHVHPGNSTSPSQQDDDTMKILEDGNEWFLRGIFGRNGRAEFTLFDYAGKVRFEDVPWEVVLPESEERKSHIQKLVDELVHTTGFAYQSNYRSFERLGGSTPLADDLMEEGAFPRGTIEFSGEEILEEGGFPGEIEPVDAGDKKPN